MQLVLLRVFVIQKNGIIHFYSMHYKIERQFEYVRHYLEYSKQHVFAPSPFGLRAQGTLRYPQAERVRQTGIVAFRRLVWVIQTFLERLQMEEVPASRREGLRIFQKKASDAR